MASLKDLQEAQGEWVGVNNFRHALTHVQKAGGKLAEIVDDVDHALAKMRAGEGYKLAEPAAERVLFARAEDVQKYVADLVICAMKLAETCPSGRIDLESAVADRMREKKLLVGSDRDCG